MCTNIDYKATKKAKDALKKKGGKGHAWKVVHILDDRWLPPFRYYYCFHSYNKSRVNLASGDFVDIPNVDFDINFEIAPLRVTEGVFHCCLTRKIARQIVKQQLINEKNYKGEIWSYKVVKVVFNAKDFVCVGKMNRIDQESWKLPYENDSICVRKFKFANK